MNTTYELVDLLIIALCATLLVILFTYLKKRPTTPPEKALFSRHQGNPLLIPQEDFHWESEAVFNPAAIADKKGNVHLLYRALGKDGVSRIGYARKKLGMVEERLPYPAHSHSTSNVNVLPHVRRYHPGLNASGGGWAGAEDPRIVNLEGRVFLTYSAFQGWDSLRMAMVSLSEENFFRKRFTWSRPIFFSPKGQVHKNWVLFPQRIKGKFAILTSITPKVSIEYYESLEEFETRADSVISIHKQIPSSDDRWEEYIRGVGPPPLYTEKGWVVFYHAIEKEDPGKYKIGALLLDKEQPEKIIARSTYPLLSPEESYENEGKSGVVYACGAVLRDSVFHLYYGGGDRVVCSANLSMKDLFRSFKMS